MVRVLHSAAKLLMANYMRMQNDRRNCNSGLRRLPRKLNVDLQIGIFHSVINSANEREREKER